jgi:hypothetical protein
MMHGNTQLKFNPHLFVFGGGGGGGGGVGYEHAKYIEEDNYVNEGQEWKQIFARILTCLSYKKENAAHDKI